MYLAYSIQTAKIHVVDNARDRQPLGKLNEAYEWAPEQYRTYNAKGAVLEYPETLEFESLYHASDTTAMKAISREFGVRDDRFSAFTIASLKPLSYFEAGASKLSTMPVLMLP